MATHAVLQPTGKRLSQFFRSFPVLPQQVRLWSVLWTAKRLGIVRRPFDVLDRRPAAFKHLGHYICASFSTSERVEVLRFTYAFLQTARRRSVDLRLCERSLVWSTMVDGVELAVWLGPTTLAPMEGEAALTFTSNGLLLFTLSFSIAPGRMVGAKTSAILIGGFQGALSCRLESRDACRRLHEIAPQDMLLVALRALAGFLQIDVIAGISTGLHVAQATAHSDRTYDYDALWERLGATRTSRGFFLFSPAARESSASAGERGQRSRARRKRRMRADLQKQVMNSLALRFLTPADGGKRVGSIDSITAA